MFNIDHSVAALRSAETILSTKLLTDEERITLLEGLVTSMPSTMRAEHFQASRQAISRKLEELHGKRDTKKENGKAERIEEQAEVAEGSSGRSETEEVEGTSEGSEEQAEDDTRFSCPDPKRKPRKAKRRSRKT
jgi:hypothetical protein